jgi:hypothetical protein
MPLATAALHIAEPTNPLPPNTTICKRWKIISENAILPKKKEHFFTEPNNMKHQLLKFMPSLFSRRQQHRLA